MLLALRASAIEPSLPLSIKADNRGPVFRLLSTCTAILQQEK